MRTKPINVARLTRPSVVLACWKRIPVLMRERARLQESIAEQDVWIFRMRALSAAGKLFEVPA